MDFDTEEEMRAEVKKRITHSKTHQLENEANEKIVDWLIERNPFELADELVQHEADKVVVRQVLGMQRQGLGEDQIKEQIESLRYNQKNSTLKAFKSYFILDAIAKKEKVLVTENEVEAAVISMARQNQAEPAKFYEQLHQSGQLSELRHQMRESKVLASLRKKAGIVLHDDHHHHDAQGHHVRDHHDHARDHHKHHDDHDHGHDHKH